MNIRKTTIFKRFWAACHPVKLAEQVRHLYRSPIPLTRIIIILIKPVNFLPLLILLTPLSYKGFELLLTPWALSFWKNYLQVRSKKFVGCVTASSFQFWENKKFCRYTPFFEMVENLTSVYLWQNLCLASVTKSLSCCRW